MCGLGDDTTTAPVFSDPFPGLFQSQNPADWSGLEWLIAIGVGYVAFSVIFTARKGTQAVRRKASGVKKGVKRGLSA